jgi:hypothetical protein
MPPMNPKTGHRWQVAHWKTILQPLEHRSLAVGLRQRGELGRELFSAALRRALRVHQSVSFRRFASGGIGWREVTPASWRIPYRPAATFLFDSGGVKFPRRLRVR